ncbi:MAG: metallophosphoesterase [Actinomycetota bacterium]|nr:MAG: metallophosphoesterase [Actinomycetota bacterium]
MPFPTRTALGAAALVAGAAAGLGYSLLEARSYRLRQSTVPVLRPGQPPLAILHLSDLHLTPDQQDKRTWVAGLAALQPDAVIVTGDFLAHLDAVPHVLDALEPLLGLPGAFVLGSNDYFAPARGNPARYLLGPSSAPPPSRPPLPWPDLVAGLTAAGWLDLSNAHGVLLAAGRAIDIRGVDDPHIRRDRYDEVAGPFDPAADLALGVAHAPYLRVLDAMAADGASLVLAGHTHGGQLRLPGYGALVTNCDIDRHRARGLSRHPKPFEPGIPGLDDPALGGVDGRGAFLHVSAGLGTSPYAPVRFACPPEATLLTLVPATS